MGRGWRAREVLLVGILASVMTKVFPFLQFLGAEKKRRNKQTKNLIFMKSLVLLSIEAAQETQAQRGYMCLITDNLSKKEIILKPQPKSQRAHFQPLLISQPFKSLPHSLPCRATEKV